MNNNNDEKNKNKKKNNEEREKKEREKFINLFDSNSYFIKIKKKVIYIYI
jgi:hypothetical protein